MRDGNPTYVCWSKREEKEVDKQQREMSDCRLTMVCRECGEMRSVTVYSGELVRFGCACGAMTEAKVDIEDVERLRHERDQINRELVELRTKLATEEQRKETAWIQTSAFKERLADAREEIEGLRRLERAHRKAKTAKIAEFLELRKLFIKYIGEMILRGWGVDFISHNSYSYEEIDILRELVEEARNDDVARLRSELDRATRLRELFVKYIENVILCEGVDFIDAYPYSDGVDLLSEEKKVLRELAEEAHKRV
jgi:hypothetical protein